MNKNEQKFYQHSNFTTMFKSEAIKRFFVKNVEIWSKQQQQPLINTLNPKFIFGGQQRKTIPWESESAFATEMWQKDMLSTFVQWIGKSLQI